MGGDTWAADSGSASALKLDGLDPQNSRGETSICTVKPRKPRRSLKTFLVSVCSGQEPGVGRGGKRGV